ncbi:aminoglycoside phosphotransferase family protein [Pseudomonas abietaniphila]|uniref:aminoglycoside phosphotransferase family protein n=1 Tax=Pseudomonas abietaniphila TaxID=89065 RepID=UPI000B2D13B3
MLKVARIPDEEAGYRLLTWWDGQGAARVFASAAGALLMERASGAGDLAQIAWSGQDDEACRIYLICARQNVKTAALDLARERQAHEAGARTRATAHERTPQQERQKAAREAERGREAWTLGQGMKKPVAGCYGRLTRWKGGGDVVYMALL